MCGISGCHTIELKSSITGHWAATRRCGAAAGCRFGLGYIAEMLDKFFDSMSIHKNHLTSETIITTRITLNYTSNQRL